MKKKVSTQQLVTSIGILFWIFTVNVVALVLLPGVPAWPMFFITIFFFTLGADTKNIASIFVSGLTGIVSAWALIKLLALLGPVMGEFPAMLLLLFLVLALIIVGGNYFPLVFNNITFAYLTVAAIDLTIVETTIVEWVAMHLLGGTIILVGALAISILVGKMLPSKYEQIDI
ncbi:MAG: hypothetical protein ACK5L0_05535 [Candidatus Fimivivens sp.]